MEVDSMYSTPYAPTSTYTPSIRAQDLDTEIKLYNSTKERELYESLGEIFSIIVTLDLVEKAYLRDTISQSDYTPTCLRLIAQYNTILKNEEVAKEFDNLDAFKHKYGMSHTHASQRLRIGVPATVEQAVDTATAKSAASPAPMASNGASSSVSAKAVAEATGNFITTMDGLRLNFKAKDQLHPLLSELMTSLNKVTTSDFEGRGKIVQWLIKLNGMKVNEELSEEDSRQLLFDLDGAYKAFYKTLE
jgi:ESCRT-I complex subunit VPS28